MATPTKQELDQINSLLNDIQIKYDQLGKENPFKGFDTKNIKDVNASIKQLDAGLKGVNSEINNTNDEFQNVFASLQSIVGELTNGKSAINQINSATKTLTSISGNLLSQREQGIKLDTKELISMQKKSDLAFSTLKQQREEVKNQAISAAVERDNALLNLQRLSGLEKQGKLNEDQLKNRKENLQKLKESNKLYNESITALGNANAILDESSNKQDTITRGLSNELKDRQAIEGSIGIAGGLLTSLSKVTGITGIFDINQIKANAELAAAEAINTIKQGDDFQSKIIPINLDIVKAKDKLTELTSSLIDTSSVDEDIKEKYALITEAEEIGNKELASQLNDGLADLEKQKQDIIEKNKPIQVKIGEVNVDLSKANDEFDNLQQSARESVNDATTQFKILGNTMLKTFEGLGNTLKSPEAIFTALVAAAGQVNSQVVDLAKSMNVSYEEGQKIRGEFAGIAASTSDITVTTKRLVEAQMQFNEALGISGKIIPENAAAQSKLTNQLGIGADSATKLRQIAEATGVSLEEQKLAQYESISAMSAQEGVGIDVKEVMDEVGKAGAYGLAQFQGSVVALTEGVAQAKALGLSLDQVNSIAGKLLDFESSINAELQAELLLGRDINLEKARLAALNNDQKTLMEEINREMGDFEDFSNMNRIQQEAMADAIGMSVDGLSESLLMQQYGEMSQREIVALKGEEVAKQVEMLKTQEAFGLLIEKLQGALTDLAAGPLGSIAKFFTDILGESTAIALVIGGLGFGKLISGLPALINGLKVVKGLEIGASIAKMWGSYSAFMGPAAIPVAVGATAAMLASIAAYSKMDDGIIPGYGKRILSTPEGKIAFNDKDTIVAGTNLEQNSVINKPTTNSMVSNNTTTQTVAPANNARMESELSAIKRVLENIATKEGTVSMNGTKFGTVTAMNTYQIQ